MQAAAACVGDVGLDREDAELLHESLGSRAAALELEGDDAAGAVRHVFLSDLVVGIARKPRIVHVGDLRVVCEEGGQRHAVVAVALHADMQALKPEVQDEGILWGLNGAEVAHELGGAFCDEGAAQAELLGVGDPVVALVRCGEARELVCVGHPVELAGVDDCSADRCAVAVHVLGGRVGDDVGTELDRAAVDRCREGVVHDERHTVGVGCVCEFLKIKDGQSRIGDGLAEDRLRVGLEGLIELLGRAVRGDEGEVDAHFPHGDVEEIVGAAVDGGAGNDMVALVRDVEDREEVGGLARGGQHAGCAAFEIGDLGGHVIVGRVLQAGVEIAAGLEVKQLAHVGAGVVLEGRALHDRHLAGLAVAGAVAGLHTVGIDTPIVHNNILLWR